VLLVSSLRDVKQYLLTTRCVSSLVALSTGTHGVVGLNAGHPKTFFSFMQAHVVILHYTKNYYVKVLYFLEIRNHSVHDLMTALSVALESIQARKVSCPLCWYYRK
jgi:hypothetical protein